MLGFDSTIMLYIIGALLLVALVVLFRGGRFRARFKGGAVDAGGGVSIETVTARRDAKIDASGDAVRIKDISADRDAHVRARQKS
jgi:hypothetical protein